MTSWRVLEYCTTGDFGGIQWGSWIEGGCVVWRWAIMTFPMISCLRTIFFLLSVPSYVAETWSVRASLLHEILSALATKEGHSVPLSNPWVCMVFLMLILTWELLDSSETFSPLLPLLQLFSHASQSSSPAQTCSFLFLQRWPTKYFSWQLKHSILSLFDWSSASESHLIGGWRRYIDGGWNEFGIWLQLVIGALSR